MDAKREHTHPQNCHPDQGRARNPANAAPPIRGRAEGPPQPTSAHPQAHRRHQKTPKVPPRKSPKSPAPEKPQRSRPGKAPKVPPRKSPKSPPPQSRPSPPRRRRAHPPELSSRPRPSQKPNKRRTAHPRPRGGTSSTHFSPPPQHTAATQTLPKSRPGKAPKARPRTPAHPQKPAPSKPSKPAPSTPSTPPQNCHPDQGRAINPANASPLSEAARRDLLYPLQPTPKHTAATQELPKSRPGKALDAEHTSPDGHLHNAREGFATGVTTKSPQYQPCLRVEESLTIGHRSEIMNHPGCDRPQPDAGAQLLRLYRHQ